MTVEVLYYVSQIVAVIVIVATLVAILWQGYQTNKIARADLTLSMWMQAGAMNVGMIDSEDKAAFMYRLFDPAAALTEQEKVRASFVLYTAAGIYEAAFNLRERGLIEEAAYLRSQSAFRAYLTGETARKWWRRHRGEEFHVEFARIVDAMVDAIENGMSGENPSRDRQA